MSKKEECQQKAKVALQCLCDAVREDLLKKAKLGQTAVIADEKGYPRVVPAQVLVARWL